VFEKIEQTIASWSLPRFLENLIIALFSFFVATLIHELGHVLTALILGCPAGIQHIGMISGATGVAECPAWQLGIIALGGPVFAWLMGIVFWFSEEKKSRMRFISILLWLLSSAVQLIPANPLDGYQAIKFGISPLVVWSIFLITFSISSNLLIDEITD